MRNIRDLREDILTLQSQIQSFDVQYRLAEMHDRLGDFVGGPTAAPKNAQGGTDPLVARVVPEPRRS
jgi:hypothetical protein